MTFRCSQYNYFSGFRRAGHMRIRVRDTEEFLLALIALKMVFTKRHYPDLPPI